MIVFINKFGNDFKKAIGEIFHTKFYFDNHWVFVLRSISQALGQFRDCSINKRLRITTH